MESKSKVKVGDIICSTSCGEFEVIKRDIPGKATIRFLKTGYVVESYTDVVRDGNIKDPYFPQVLGVGYLGVGEFVSRIGSSLDGFNSVPEYNAWQNMLQRCYYDKYETRVVGCTAYDTVEVCDEWHNFQNFAKWYTQRRRSLDEAGVIKPSLDKEILAPTKKAILYSPETCCVVPSEINTMLIGMNRSKFNGLPKGIFKIKEGYRVRALSVNSVNISNKFATIAECNKWRNSVDQSRFIFVANKYKSVLESAVYERLCNWDKF